MSVDHEGLLAHARTGATTLCRAWSITRADGVHFGFTDHDCALSFDGMTFKADSGLSALALAQSTGLSVDNTEAIGALTDAAVREDEIEAGRFDGAEVSSWLVNWQNPSQRRLLFTGVIGEIKRAGGAFHAEVRGLSEKLNVPLGRIYQKPCTAVLGDGQCRFSLSQLGYSETLPVVEVEDARWFTWPDLAGFDEGWFTSGRLDVLDGPAAGLWSAIKFDRRLDAGRVIELWEPIRLPVEAGTTVRLSAGCDKRFETCRLKFNNLTNFQGFPDIPGEDWMMAVPRKTAPNTGGSRR